MNSWPKVSVIVPTYNNCITLRKVLQAMAELNYPSEFEVIVIDDGSSDGTKEMLEKEFSSKNNFFIIHQSNSGVCKARNAGIKKARFPIIINMDHDCIPGKEWLKEMVKGFDNEKVGVVTAYGGFGGTSTGFRKKALDMVGGYDEDYVYYREDTDLTFKIIELGYQFRKISADYFHDHEEVKPTNIKDIMKYLITRLKYHMNDVLLYKKHPNKLTKDFLHIKFGFLVSPLTDFKTATGLWEKQGKLKLSSPRGIVFIENKTLLHSIIIIFLGIAYVFAVKVFRMWGSIKYKKFLI